MISDSELGDIKEAAKVMPDASPRREEQPDEDIIDPKLEKILKVCSAVVAVIIIVVILLIIGKVSGWWGKPSGKAEETPKPQVTNSSEPSSSSAAASLVKVPDIRNHSLEEAEKMLLDARLKYSLEAVKSEAEANMVTGQDPEPDEEVEEYTIVTIYYSQKEADIIIPKLENYSVDSAMTELEDNGLAVSGKTEVYSDTIEAGKVCGTEPVAGSAVKKGTAVTILVSKGPESKTTKVPNIVGKKVSVALNRLAERGLKGNTSNVSYINSDRYPEDVVVSQSVPRDTEVEVGTVIDYAVSLGPKVTATEEPDVTEEPTPEPPEPTDDISYTYKGSVTVSGNPFDFADDSGTVTLVLTQDGTKKTVWEGELGYDDFPRKFEVTGWSENNGTVTVFMDGVSTGNSYNVEFKKVRD